MFGIFTKTVIDAQIFYATQQKVSYIYNRCRLKCQLFDYLKTNFNDFKLGFLSRWFSCALEIKFQRKIRNM